VKIDIFNRISPKPCFEGVQRFLPKSLDAGTHVTP
jgi:hypothetical protein